MVNQKVCKKKYLSWVYGVDSKILSLGITVRHHSASLVMPISDPHDRFFYPHHTPMIDTYYLLPIRTQGLYDIFNIFNKYNLFQIQPHTPPHTNRKLTFSFFGMSLLVVDSSSAISLNVQAYDTLRHILPGGSLARLFFFLRKRHSPGVVIGGVVQKL